MTSPEELLEFLARLGIETRTYNHPPVFTVDDAIDPLNYHPLTNDRTTAISPSDLTRFLSACDHDPTVLDF